MIIFLLILCVLGFAYTNVFGRKVWHKCCMVIFGLGFLASLSLIVLNDKDHFGMTEVTQDKTFELKSSSSSKDGPNMLLYQPLGDEQGKTIVMVTHDVIPIIIPTIVKNTRNLCAFKLKKVLTNKLAII